MKHLDLFSGIGGFSLAASWVWGDDHEIVSFVEIDKFCQKILKKHWPDVPIIPDIREVVTPEKYRPTIDLLTGGFPCQPYSVAGKQRGAKDDRALWPQMLRVIQEIRPTWVIGENVAGIINMELDQVLSDLESASYETQAFLIPACGVDAPHRRDRVWVVAHSRCSNVKTRYSNRMGVKEPRGRLQTSLSSCENLIANMHTKRLQKRQGKNSKGTRADSRAKFGRVSEWRFEPGLGNLADGISRWLAEPNIPRVATGVQDRVNKLKALGNAIVPQCVVPIMQAIKEIEEV